MAALVCDLCGGKLIMGAGGIAICDSCGMEHSPDRMREKVQEIKGVVRVDNTHMVGNYLEMANSAYDADNNKEAETYCNKVIEIDPLNYKAWMLKGKAAGWQSTLQNSRIPESVAAFAKAIRNAPEDEKDEIIEEVKRQIKNLLLAMMSLQLERFDEWPDEEETAAIVKLMAEILNTVISFASQTGLMLSINEITGPIVEKIDESITHTFVFKISEDYKNDRYPYPDRDDWEKYLNRINYCITIVEKTIALCSNDDVDDIRRYKNLIYFENKAIESCSYNSKYLNYDPYRNGSASVRRYEEVVRKNGHIPDAANSRYWFVEYVMSDSGKAARKRRIAEFEAKIRAIEAKIQQDKKEAARKRFDEYWEEHAEEKKKLESEKNVLENQIRALKVQLDEIPGLTEKANIEQRIKLWTAEKDSLGLFKGKEKKILQEKIDDANKALQNVSSNIDSAKKEIDSKIAVVQQRINAINSELCKER